MNEIETATITSMEVAEMTGKTHYNLLRSIASYEKHFSQCALFEADGGAWKLHAMESIQEYLEEQLKGVDGFTIIS